MINLNGSALIYRPIRQVFDFVSMPENDFQWHYGTLAATRLAEGIPSKGTFFRSVGHWMGRRSLSTFEVTEYKPDHNYGFKSLSGPLSSRTSYLLDTADNGSTTIVISVKADAVDLFEMDEGIVEKEMKKQLSENLVTLKDLLEAESITR